MGYWFRFYDEVLEDPKVQRLPSDLFKAWVNLLCLASKHDGVLPSLESVTFALRVTVDEASKIVTSLSDCGLLDHIKGKNLYAPHNWSGRQYRSDRKDLTAGLRQKRYRDRLRHERISRHATVTATSPVTATEADTDSEQTQNQNRKRARASALAAGWPEDFKDQFWTKYPNKVGKPKALAKLKHCMRRGVSWSAIMEGLTNYIETKPADRAWLNPETFINQERWTDQPAASDSANNTPPLVAGLWDGGI